MHTRCVHTTPATRTARITLEFSPAHRALPGGARAASTLHATPAVLRTGAHPHRHGKQLSRGELPGLQRASRAGGESARGPAWDPAEALRGASAQCCPPPGADRAESQSRLSNRRRPRVVPAGGRILRRKTREERVGGGRLWIFGPPEVWDLPRSSVRFLVFCNRFLRCSILVPRLGFCLDWLPFPTFVRGFRQGIWDTLGC